VIEAGPGLIYHVTTVAEWQQAKQAGSYGLSTRGAALEDVGFIHCSQEHQVAGVLNSFYAGLRHLLLLVIAEDRVTSSIRYENLQGGDERFPHIYGPLNLDAVIEVRPLRPRPDGSFGFPTPAGSDADPR
jgi:glutathione S-transferase